MNIEPYEFEIENDEYLEFLYIKETENRLSEEEQAQKII